ncbi:MAG: SpoIIE family protein phosphatase [Chloroflexi bacterium]|nr:SpoIIE family protein phosphatase [Chloroflexota bacterium]
MDERLTVLVVDDEPFNVDYLIQELEDFGVDTITAENGVVAMAQIEAHAPDLVLLDIMMPKMGGFDVLETMKARESMRDIPVIIISAHSEMEQVLKGIEMGAEDYLPKPFDPLLLKARVNASLEKKRFRNLEKQYLESMARELRIGKDIQAGFLPGEIHSPKGWEIAAYFEAAREVSGDFYDVFALPDGRVGLMVGDVTDKGVGSALYMALYRSLLRATALQNAEAESKDLLQRAVDSTNRYICGNHEQPRYLTLFFGILEPTTGVLQYVSAGHDHPFLINSKGGIRPIKPTGPLIGFSEEMTFAVEQTLIGSADCLLIYTDGVTDIRNENESFGRERLMLEAAKPEAGAKKRVDGLVGALKVFCGDRAHYDDITLLAVQRKA